MVYKLCQYASVPLMLQWLFVIFLTALFYTIIVTSPNQLIGLQLRNSCFSLWNCETVFSHLAGLKSRITYSEIHSRGWSTVETERLPINSSPNMLWPATVRLGLRWIKPCFYYLHCHPDCKPGGDQHSAECTLLVI